MCLLVVVWFWRQSLNFFECVPALKKDEQSECMAFVLVCDSVELLHKNAISVYDVFKYIHSRFMLL